jgi:cytochrome c oxidase subunit 3
MSDSTIDVPAGIALPDPLREPWSELARQQEAATIGMWLFLMSEMLFFGAVFMAFSFTRALNVAAFEAGAHETEIVYGASNTVVLVTSSLTITLAVRAAGAENPRLAARLLAATAALGFAFLVVKGFEYRSDLEHHLYPGRDFHLGQTAAEIFWAFYWIMTGVHAVHLAIGVGLVSRLTWLVRGNRLSLRSPQLEVTSLYWHLVDAFWIVLFPVLYIAGRG